MTCQTFAVRRASSAIRGARFLGCLAALAVLAGCAGGQHTRVSAVQEAAHYAAAARRNYTAPGPVGDPWGPYIVEAAAKYDVPEVWVREVMRQESDSQLYENGQLITSDAGAMGLMQVMPQTYDELRQRYGLGDDPYDPHDNIMAGTAYIRELYDAYGTPAFLAAYNAGPGRLEDYLNHNRTLPDETRHYVARIGPRIAGVYPQRQSDATQVAMMTIPVNIPPGPRYPRHPAPAPVALAENRLSHANKQHGAIQVASLPQPPAPPPQLVAFEQPRPQTHGVHLIPRAMADTLPLRAVGPLTGAWAIQVGAFGNAGQALAAAEAARVHARDMLGSAQPTVGTVKQAHAILYRARLTGLSREAAVQACEKLARHGGCIVVSPAA